VAKRASVSSCFSFAEWRYEARNICCVALIVLDAPQVGPACCDLRSRPSDSKKNCCAIVGACCDCGALKAATFANKRMWGKGNTKIGRLRETGQQRVAPSPTPHPRVRPTPHTRCAWGNKPQSSRSDLPREQGVRDSADTLGWALRNSLWVCAHLLSPSGLWLARTPTPLTHRCAFTCTQIFLPALKLRQDGGPLDES
jgi:hypothetical protein